MVDSIANSYQNTWINSFEISSNKWTSLKIIFIILKLICINHFIQLFFGSDDRLVSNAD